MSIILFKCLTNNLTFNDKKILKYDKKNVKYVREAINIWDIIQQTVKPEKTCKIRKWTKKYQIVSLWQQEIEWVN